MKSAIEENLRKDAFDCGKKQIENHSFSLAIVNSDFKKLINTIGLTQESNKELFDKLNKSFIEGQRFAIQTKYKEALKELPKEIIDKYGNSIDYDINQDEFDNFYELNSKLELIKNIPEIEKVKSGIKVLVFWSESTMFRDNQVMSIEEFKTDCDLALAKLEKERERLGLSGGYEKTKYMFIFDDGKGQVGTTNAIRYDIGDFNSFNDYLNKGFSNKNIPKIVQRYLNLEEVPEDEDEEVQ